MLFVERWSTHAGKAPTQEQEIERMEELADTKRLRFFNWVEDWPLFSWETWVCLRWFFFQVIQANPGNIDMEHHDFIWKRIHLSIGNFWYPCLFTRGYNKSYSANIYSLAMSRLKRLVFFVFCFTNLMHAVLGHGKPNCCYYMLLRIRSKHNISMWRNNQSIKQRCQRHPQESHKLKIKWPEKSVHRVFFTIRYLTTVIVAISPHGYIFVSFPLPFWICLTSICWYIRAVKYKDSAGSFDTWYDAGKANVQSKTLHNNTDIKEHAVFWTYLNLKGLSQTFCL